MNPAARMDNIPFSKIRKVFEEVTRREKAGQEIIHLEIGRPDFDTPANIKAAAKAALDRGQVHYTSNYGLIELRRAIADKLDRENGIKADPETDIITTVGVAEGIMISIMAFLDPGDEIIIPTPCFPSYITTTHLAGAVPVRVELKEEDGFEPDIAALEAAVTPRTKMILLTSPSNPTGVVLSRQTLEAVADLAQRRDLLVISDEIYEKMIYEGAEHLSIATLPGLRERTIILNGFSKNYAMTGWRLGYAVSTPEIIGALVRVHQNAVVCATSFAQWGAVEALTGPQDAVAEMVTEFDRRRRMVVERLSAMPGLSLVTPKGAFYALPNISSYGKTPLEMAGYLLDEARIAVVPFGQDYVRLSYATSYENLERAMDQMAEALGKLG